MFLLTHLLRGVTIAIIIVLNLVIVSTHTPPARCDSRSPRHQQSLPVSTHTPPARCDMKSVYRHSMMDVSTHTPPARCDSLAEKLFS